jgi:hypothetical protein
MLMEQLEYNLLFRWFVGLSANEAVWHATVFTKNRDRLLEGAVAEEFFSLIVKQARAKKLLSEEHFTVDGTLIEAWAGQNNFQRRKSDNDVGSCPRTLFSSLLVFSLSAVSRVTSPMTGRVSEPKQREHSGD